MVALARSAGVPVLLINPIHNLDIPPFKSRHGDGLDAGALRAFDALREAARDHFGDDMPGAIDLLRRAIAIDDRHAGVHYELAKCYQQAGRTDEARDEFIRAKEEDLCPLRILEPMSRAVLDIGRETGTPVIDQVALFSARSRGGILGGDWLIDHVHPTIAGHQAVAGDLLDDLTRRGLLRPVPGWGEVRDRRVRAHLASLDDAYYLMGQKRLGNLRLWAEGRGNRLRTSPSAHPDGERPRIQPGPTSSTVGNARGGASGDD